MIATPRPAAAAADLKSKGHEGVLAKLDATADDAGEIDGVAGYPTMLLYRGGKKVSHPWRPLLPWPRSQTEQSAGRWTSTRASEQRPRSPSTC